MRRQNYKKIPELRRFCPKKSDFNIVGKEDWHLEYQSGSAASTASAGTR